MNSVVAQTSSAVRALRRQSSIETGQTNSESATAPGLKLTHSRLGSASQSSPYRVRCRKGALAIRSVPRTASPAQNPAITYRRKTSNSCCLSRRTASTTIKPAINVGTSLGSFESVASGSSDQIRLIAPHARSAIIRSISAGGGRGHDLSRKAQTRTASAVTAINGASIRCEITLANGTIEAATPSTWPLWIRLVNVLWRSLRLRPSKAMRARAYKPAANRDPVNFQGPRKTHSPPNNGAAPAPYRMTKRRR